MNLFKRQANIEQLRQLSEEGAALRQMFEHPARAIVEKRLEQEIEWVHQEWKGLLESESDKFLEDQKCELYAYLRALQLMQFIFLETPRIGWRAEDKLLAFTQREKVYSTK